MFKIKLHDLLERTQQLKDCINKDNESFDHQDFIALVGANYLFNVLNLLIAININ